MSEDLMSPRYSNENWLKKKAPPVCRNCGKTKDDHIDNKCLYLPTSWELKPLEAFWRIAYER